MEKLIKALPKVNLHLHLVGSMRVNTIIELAQKNTVKLPTDNKEELKEYLQVTEGCNNREEYLKKFELPVKVLQTKEDLTRVAYEIAEDAAWDNVKYLEVRFPPLLLMDSLSKEVVIEAILSGLNRAEKEYNLHANLILSCMREQDPARSIELAQLAIKYKEEGIVALDLVGDEVGFPPEEHERAFVLAKEAGLHRTVHAGAEGGVDNIRKAIDYLAAERIGHGIKIKESLEVLEYVKELGVFLEICPTSNLHTGLIDDFEDHPIKDYYQSDLLLTVNTNNQTVSNITLSEEYLKLHYKFGFKLEDIIDLIVNGVKAAFINEDEREILLNRFNKQFEEILEVASNR